MCSSLSIRPREYLGIKTDVMKVWSAWGGGGGGGVLSSVRYGVPMGGGGPLSLQNMECLWEEGGEVPCLCKIWSAYGRRRGGGGPLSLQGMECLWEEEEGGGGSLVSARYGVPMGGGGGGVPCLCKVWSAYGRRRRGGGGGGSLVSARYGVPMGGGGGEGVPCLCKVWSAYGRGGGGGGGGGPLSLQGMECLWEEEGGGGGSLVSARYGVPMGGGGGEGVPCLCKVWSAYGRRGRGPLSLQGVECLWEGEGRSLASASSVR